MGKHFYYLWGSISSGKLAMSLYTMTITLLIFTITNSATFASLVMLIYVIGKIVSSFIFPFVTEKIPLKKILSFSLFAQLFIMLLIIYVFNDDGLLYTTLKLMIIYMLIAFTGFTDGFVSPSRMSLIPESVEEKALGKANSLISTTDQTFALLGWSIGTVAINIYGSNSILMVCIILLILSILSSLQIKATTIKKSPKRPSLDIMKEGWVILFSKKNHMRTITMMDILEGIASGIWIGGITLVFVHEVLKKGEQWWGFLNSGYFVGSIIGGMLIAVLSTRLEKYLTKGIVIGSFFVSLFVLLYAMNTTAWIALLLVVLMGPFYQLRDISQQTYIQRNIKGLAKFYAAKDNLYYIVFALSVFLSGLISDYIGVVYVYYFAFILYFISSIAAAFTFRRVSKINKNYDAITTMNDVSN